jgi:phospholipase C
MGSGLTRREVLRAGAAAGALVGLERASHMKVIERALAAAPAATACHGLSDIEHVVIFINENRSFDQYFGGYKGVRGFGDRHGPNVFAQSYPGPAGVPYGGRLLPFHFDTALPHNGECVNDVSHEWGATHRVWNGGAMDKWLEVHLQENGQRDGPNTMGYYQRSDIPFYHALADAFTLCDNYFCSLLGPTDPNRLYSMTGTIDPDGKAGGPHLKTLVTDRPSKRGAFSWTTYPEQLETGGISWKIYATPDGNAGDNILPYFKQYNSNPTLAAKAFAPSFPAEFQADCAAGTLPQVSWVLGPLVDTEHPPAPVTFGEVVVAQVLDAITSNPALWAKTALFVTYDENGGFFDHVPPPVAPPGTPGEYLTVSTLPAEAQGIRGPIGLGPRVPTLVVSPFARGGLVCSDAFDHTSMLRFLETRFGPEVPNLTAWRRSVTGDMTSAFHFAHPDASVPSLPKPNRADPRVLGSDCPTQAPGTGSDSFPTVVGYQLPPPPQTMPGQDPGAARRPSGLCGSAAVQQHHPLFETGVATQGNPLGLPSARTCKNPRRFAFRLHQPSRGRFVQVRVYVNGRRVKTIRARGKSTIRSVVLTGLPANFTLAVVAITNRNRRIVSKRKYRSCR